MCAEKKGVIHMPKVTKSIKTYVRKVFTLKKKGAKEGTPVSLKGFIEVLKENQRAYNALGEFFYDIMENHVDDYRKKGINEVVKTIESLTWGKSATSPVPSKLIEKELNGKKESIIGSYTKRSVIADVHGVFESYKSNTERWEKRSKEAKLKGKKFTDEKPSRPTINFHPSLYEEMDHIVDLNNGKPNGKVRVCLFNGKKRQWYLLEVDNLIIPEGYELNCPRIFHQHPNVMLSFAISKKVSFTSKNKFPGNVMGVDLNLNGHLAVIRIINSENKVIKTAYLGKLTEHMEKREELLDAINMKRKQTAGTFDVSSKRGNGKNGKLQKNENVTLWNKIRNTEDNLAHQVSAEIVKLAKEHNCDLIVFEYLDSLKPSKEKYGKKSNRDRGYWMKSRVFNQVEYKAHHEGIRVNKVSPKNTSKMCACCNHPIHRYTEDQTKTVQDLVDKRQQGELVDILYTVGARLFWCPECNTRGNADANAAKNIALRGKEKWIERMVG